MGETAEREGEGEWERGEWERGGGVCRVLMDVIHQEVRPRRWGISEARCDQGSLTGKHVYM